MNIQLIRHATSILFYNNKKILVDPVLSPKNTISAIENVPNKDNNPLVDLPLPLEAVFDCDAVLISHTHRDHFDDFAKKMLPKDLVIICQPEDEDKIRESGFKKIIPVNDFIEWEGIRFIRTKGKHGHGVIAMKMAPVSGFVISAQGEPVVYLTGDTVWYSEVRKSIEKFKPEIIIAYCGEARFSYGRAITMNSRDVLSLCRNSSAKIIAVHMDAWNHCRLTRTALREFAAANDLISQVIIPENGELVSI